MNTLNNIVKRSLSLNEKRTLVTLIGIILSVALLSAVSSIYMSAIKSYVSYEKKINGNFHVALYDVPKEDIYIFKNNRKIDSVYYTKEIGYSNINSKNDYKPYAYVVAYSSGALENLTSTLEKGRMPKNDSEIVIPTTLKTNGRVNLKVGDTITLNVGKRVSNGYKLDQSSPYGNLDEDSENDESIIETVEKTYKVVGVTDRMPKSIEGGSAPGYTFITYLNDNKINESTNIYIRYKEKNVKDVYNLTADILGVERSIFKKANNINTIANLTDENRNKLESAKYNYIMNTDLIRAETDPFGMEDNKYLSIVAVIVIIIIIFTSVFCIKSSFDISVSEKIKEYGLLKSIGATKKQIRKNVLYEGFVLGLIAIPLGVLLGIIASIILVLISNHFMNLLGLRFTLEYSFSIVAIFLSIVLGVITIYLSSIKVSRKASLASPIESIRNSNDIKIKSKNLKTPKIIYKLFGIGGVISYKNIKRNSKKYRVTIVSIIIAVITVISLSEFINLSFRNAKEKVNVNDFNLELTGTIKDNNSLKKYNETTALEDVKKVYLRRMSIFETELSYSKEFKKKRSGSAGKDTMVNIISISDNEYKKYISKLGLNYNDVKDKGILIDFDNVYKDHSKEILHTYNTKVGYTINIKEQNSDNSYDIEITSIPNIKSSSLGGGRLNLEGILVSGELFDKITENSDCQIEIEYNSTNPNKTQDEIDGILKNEDYNLTNENEINERNRNFLTLVYIFLYGFIIVISLVSITSIINVVTTNVMLRSKEFATLKSIGMTKKEFNKMINLEGIFIEIKSLFYGIIIGLIISYVIYYYFDKAEEVTYIFPLKEIIILIIVVVILISSIMRSSIKKINKQNIIETIRNENI